MAGGCHRNPFRHAARATDATAGELLKVTPTYYKWNGNGWENVSAAKVTFTNKFTGTTTATLGVSKSISGRKWNGNDSFTFKLTAENGVRYTVPQTLDTENMNDQVVVRFRVADVYQNRSICVYYDDQKISSVRKKVLAPGEMEQVVLKKDSFKDYPDLKNIRICTEEA